MLSYVLDIQVVESRKGSQLLLIKDYTYCHTNRFTSTNHWRCSSHNGRGCKARLVLNSNKTIVSANYEHNHPPAKYIVRLGKFFKI